MGLNDGYTTLHKASYDGDMEKVNEILNPNINVEDVIRDASTLCMYYWSLECGKYFIG